MHIEHAEFNLQRQLESSNSAVNIIDDVDSSSQTKKLANQLASKDNTENRSSSQFGKQTTIKSKFVSSHNMQDSGVSQAYAPSGAAPHHRRQMTTSTNHPGGANRYRTANNLLHQSSQEDYEGSGLNTVLSATTGGNHRMRVKNELNSQISNTNKASSTVMTDKSPGDYLNQVTINVNEAEDIGRVSSYESLNQGGNNSQTEKSVAMHGGILYQSQEQVIEVPNTHDSSSETNNIN